jgi:hypothetical protein
VNEVIKQLAEKYPADTSKVDVGTTVKSASQFKSVD